MNLTLYELMDGPCAGQLAPASHDTALWGDPTELYVRVDREDDNKMYHCMTWLRADGPLAFEADKDMYLKWFESCEEDHLSPPYSQWTSLQLNAWNEAHRYGLLT